MVADNGRLSLAEVDKAVQELYPQFDNKPALIRAFKAADRTGEGFITRKEFRLLLQGLRYFNAAWARFASLDGDGDRKLVARFAVVAYRHQRRRWVLLPLRCLQPTPLVLRLRKWSLAGACSYSASLRVSGRLSLQEFKSGCVVLGMRLSREKAEQLFREMDADGGGYVLFDEFCAWCVRQADFEDGTSADEETQDRRHAIVDDGEGEEDEEASLYGVAPERGAM